jgi:tetratricopeptide (TPR) repeat protein
MWISIIAGLALIGSVVGILTIVSKKFPQLSLIDADSLPEEQHRQRKREIVAARVNRAALAGWQKAAASLAQPLVRLRDGFRRQFKKLLTMDKQFRNEGLARAKNERREAVVAKMMTQAEKLVEQGKFGEAEKKYIEALSIDERFKPAYRGLGELCMSQKRYHRAVETYAFLVKLTVRESCDQTVTDLMGVPVPRHEAFSEQCAASPAAHAEIAKRYAELAAANQADGKTTAGRVALETAVAFEPSNPKYLDLLVEACILEGDQERAYEALAELREANPENAKVEAYGERIAALDRG